MIHEDYKEMLALHALDALDAAEARAVEDHLRSCDWCRAELAELRDASSLLAYAATPAQPSSDVRSRITSGVRAEPVRRAPETGAKRQPAPDVSAKVTSFPAFSFGWRLGALAAAVAYVALLVPLLVLWNHNAARQRELARLSSQLSERQQELAREREAVALLTAPDSRKTELAGTSVARSAHGLLAYDRRTGHAMLFTDSLPPPPPDKVYELWFIANGRPLRGQVFTTDAQGHAVISDQVPPEARERAIFAVTLEPKGGVNSPTGPIYLSSPSS